MKTTEPFTERQIEAWREFEEVRQSGAVNMMMPQVRDLCGISREEHMFILENYSELESAAKATEAR